LLAAELPEGAGLMDDLAVNFDHFEEADLARNRAADRGASGEERAGSGAARSSWAEDVWGNPGPEGHEAVGTAGALGARAGRSRRIWEEDVYGSAS